MREADITARVVALQRQTPSEADDYGESIEVVNIRPLVPDAWYDAKFMGYDTMLLFKQPKVFLRFEIVQQGEYFGKRVCVARPYRVSHVNKPVGPNGKFEADHGGDLYRMLLRVLDVKLRRDRISLQALKHLPLRILTRTVVTDRRGRPIPPLAQYSVVEDVMRAE